MRNHAQYCRLPHRICTCKFFSAEICIHIPIFPHYISPRILNMTTHILDQKPVSTVQHTFIVSKGVLYYLLDQFQLLAISIALNLTCQIIYCWHHLKNWKIVVLIVPNICFTIFLLAVFGTLFSGDLNTECTNTRANVTVQNILNIAYDTCIILLTSGV